MKILRGGLAVLVATGMAACDDGTGPGTDDSDALDLAVATVAAEATLHDVHSMALGAWGLSPAEGAAVGGMGGRSASDAGLAPRDVLERPRTITFYDADGQEMEGYDPLLTGSIDFVVQVDGSLDRPMWTGELERHRNVSVTGLAGQEAERIWNGTGSDEHSRVRATDQGDAERHFRSETLIDDVVVGVPRSEHPWPLSGTITRHVEVTVLNGPHGDVARERTVVVTFNGTRFVTLTVDGEAFEMDLADRQGRRPQRPGRP